MDNHPELRSAIGFVISLVSSVLYATGLNLIQRDAIKNAKKALEHRKSDWKRPVWCLGMGMFLISQGVGETAAIYFLPPLFVAPLGAATLIFNFLFARFLIGTRITKKDTIGTLLVILSVIWIVLWADQKADRPDEMKGDPTLKRLTFLYTRPTFICYFLIIDSITILSLFLAFYSKHALSSELRHRNSKIWKGVNRKNMSKGVGICFAAVGGLLASQTLLLGNSGISLILRSINGDNQFNQGSFLPYAIVFGLMVTAVLQIVCLNTALHIIDSVIVVPIFYSLYSAVGLVNTMVYLDEFRLYEPHMIICITVGMLSLCLGVRYLSHKKNESCDSSSGTTLANSSIAGTVVETSEDDPFEGVSVVAFEFSTPKDVDGNNDRDADADVNVDPNGNDPETPQFVLGNDDDDEQNQILLRPNSNDRDSYETVDANSHDVPSLATMTSDDGTYAHVPLMPEDPTDAPVTATSLN